VIAVEDRQVALPANLLQIEPLVLEAERRHGTRVCCGKLL